VFVCFDACRADGVSSPATKVVRSYCLPPAVVATVPAAIETAVEAAEAAVTTVETAVKDHVRDRQADPLTKHHACTAGKNDNEQTAETGST